MTRMLVIPASTHGATAEIGRSIATTLRRHGLDVDVAQPEHITDLHRYDAFVIGSAVYRGRWKSEARAFIEHHREAIRGKPCWLFSSGPVGDGLPQEPLDADEVPYLMATTGAKEHHMFGGRLDIDRLSFTERWLARWVGARNSDTREWPEIDEWAIEIAAIVIAGPAGFPE